MTTKVMSPAEMRAERVDALQQEIDTEVVNLTARLRASADFRAETRAKASDAAWMAREEEIARRPWR